MALSQNCRREAVHWRDRKTSSRRFAWVKCSRPHKSQRYGTSRLQRRRGEARALRTIAGVFERAGYGIAVYYQSIESIRQHARIALHFHPDRLGKDAVSVAEGLLSEGVYRNQFETGVSSASPTAFPGGERDLWECALFGGAYHADGVLPSERPKYGSLELARFPDGPAPRFGSCYFVLKGVGARTSITFMGSEHPQASDRVGTLAKPHGALAALLSEIQNGGMATPEWPPFRAPTLGIPGVTVRRFCELAENLIHPRPDPSVGIPGRVLDTGVEAQVHGPVVLQRDVELLVADPAFAGTATGQALHELGARFGFELKWHCGFRLPVRDVPDDFRGPAMPALAKRIAGDTSFLDAAVIGHAAASLHRNPAAWSEWGEYWDVVRLFRQIWHVLVHFGHPYDRWE